MDELIIRLASEMDSEKISSMSMEAFREFQSAYSKEAFLATVISPAEICSRISEGSVWVAEYRSQLVGTISVVPKENGMYLRGMAVLPAAQGLKIGLALLQQAERFTITNSYKRLFLRTTPYLDKAIKLYERFGFVRVGKELEDFFGTPSFVMEKNIFQY